MSGRPPPVGARRRGRGRRSGISWVWPMAPAQEPRSCAAAGLARADDASGRRPAGPRPTACGGGSSAASVARQRTTSKSPWVAPKPDLHAPDRGQDVGRHAVGLADGGELTARRRACAGRAPTRARASTAADVVADRQGEFRLAGVVGQHARIGRRGRSNSRRSTSAGSPPRLARGRRSRPARRGSRIAGRAQQLRSGAG